MINDDERREVAARLRELEVHCWYDGMDEVCALEEACGCDVGQDWQDMELKDRIAELIEPEPERTCKMELVKNGSIYSVWRFSCCGYEYSENNTDSGATELPGTRCPNCGAKVVI